MVRSPVSTPGLEIFHSFGINSLVRFRQFLSEKKLFHILLYLTVVAIYFYHNNFNYNVILTIIF